MIKQKNGFLRNMDVEEEKTSTQYFLKNIEL